MDNVFTQPLAAVVANIHARARKSRYAQALQIDSQGNVQMLPTRGVPAEQQIARCGTQIVGLVSGRADRRTISAMVLRRMCALVDGARR